MHDIIVAINQRKTIGLSGTIPWHLPNDLQHFKNITLNKSIIMGRVTFESIGKALPQRHNIVVTRNAQWKAPKTYTTLNLEQALEYAQSQTPSARPIVIGGEGLYRQALSSPNVHTVYLTLVDETTTGDRFFPHLPQELIDCGWKLISHQHHPADSKHAHSFTFYCLLSPKAACLSHTHT